MKEITTKAYRCGEATPACPGVFKLPDGRYAAQGTEVWPTGIVGPSERIVIIDPAMIAEAVAADTANLMTPELQTALIPFIAMAKACASLHDHEPIAARAVAGGNNRVIALNVMDFRRLEKAVEAAKGGAQ